MTDRIRRTLAALSVVAAALGAAAVAAPSAAVAAGSPTTDVFRYEFTDLTTPNPCTGEQITFSGTVLLLDHTSANAGTGSNHVSRSVLTASGAGSFGNSYHYDAVGIARNTVNSAGGFTSTVEFNSNIVSQSGAPNATATILFFLNLTPDGQHQVNITSVSERCLGAQQ